MHIKKVLVPQAKELVQPCPCSFWCVLFLLYTLPYGDMATLRDVHALMIWLFLNATGNELDRFLLWSSSGPHNVACVHLYFSTLYKDYTSYSAGVPT